ncbi:hypothetical protein [Blastococcus haudaquaticus]|uniref:Uncharacterized protein n=1 Tax=Blastococcus haudaquaticus TaxID=1938745 RepID=A0A286GPY7_9ACTN|nr:hypothetical protein [Blastococcus haudaquaticus]SOD97580.1 hypothetical protein SAMN06272739_1547 [Blastococcus haudaquaticus]
MTAPVSPTATSRIAVSTAAWALSCAALGLWWLLEPGAYVLDDVTNEPTSLMMVLSPAAGSLLFLVLGLLGAGLAVSLVQAGTGSAGRRALAAGGAGFAVFFGVVVPDLQVLSLLGYALAILGGPILVAILLAGSRRHRRNHLVLALMAAVVGIGVGTGQIGAPTVELFRNIRDGLATVGPRPLVLAFMLAGGLLFAATTVTAVHSADGHGDSPERLRRWGRRATILAAVCPLPYALLRMTWLTPWPQGLGEGHEEMLDDGVRVFGVSLGLAAVGGAWLTLGLISRWGEVWPAWLPGLRGRPVPVLAAVVPASVVALALSAASVSLVVMSLQNDVLWLLLMLPAPIWGPALGLATYAYYRRRTAPTGDPRALSRQPAPDARVT